jgi:hypothetical protein
VARIWMETTHQIIWCRRHAHWKWCFRKTGNYWMHMSRMFRKWPLRSLRDRSTFSIDCNINKINIYSKATFKIFVSLRTSEWLPVLTHRRSVPTQWADLTPRAATSNDPIIHPTSQDPAASRKWFQYLVKKLRWILLSESMLRSATTASS